MDFQYLEIPQIFWEKYKSNTSNCLGPEKIKKQEFEKKEKQE